VKYCIELDGSGRVVACGTHDNADPAAPLLNGAVERIVLSDPPPLPDTAYWDGARLVPLPPRPTEHHRFDYAAKAWKLDEGAAWSAVRSRRDGLLAKSDGMVLRALDWGKPVHADWLTYRQALRDITKQTTDIEKIKWPVAPQ